MRRILVADNDQYIVQSLREMLEPYYHVDTAVTGLEILDLCKAETYDGLIIDVDFGPGIDGIEMASKIRAKDKNIRILVFSATEYSDDIRRQVVDVGAIFCEKPLSLEFIRKALGDQP